MIRYKTRPVVRDLYDPHGLLLAHHKVTGLAGRDIPVIVERQCPAITLRKVVGYPRERNIDQPAGVSGGELGHRLHRRRLRDPRLAESTALVAPRR